MTTTPVLVLGHLEAAKTAGLVANTTDALVNSGVPSLFTVLGNSTLTGSQRTDALALLAVVVCVCVCVVGGLR